MAEPEYPVLRELETKLKLQWIDTDDYLATQRAIIQVEPDHAYLELPRGRKGDKGDPGNAISFQGIVARTSDLPTGLTAADAAKAWVNTATKALHVWNGDRWFTVDNFAGVDADVQRFSQWFAQAADAARTALDAADRAEYWANEVQQNVTGGFATKNYVDERTWHKDTPDSSWNIEDFPKGIWKVENADQRTRLGLPNSNGVLAMHVFSPDRQGVATAKTAYWLSLSHVSPTEMLIRSTDNVGVWEPAWRSTFDGYEPPSKQAAVPLTFPRGSSYSDDRPTLTIRIPFKFGAAVKRARLRLRNYDYRSDHGFPGSYRIVGAGIGKHQINDDGSMTGLVPEGESITQLMDSTQMTGPDEAAGEWVDINLEANTEYLLSYSFTADDGMVYTRQTAQCFTSRISSGWNRTGVTTATPSNMAVLAAILDVEVLEDTPIYGYLGDSQTAAISASRPGYDSWAMVHSRLAGAIPTIHGHAGGGLNEWQDPVKPAYNISDGMARFDRFHISMGSNDISSGRPFTGVQQYLTTAMQNWRGHTNTFVLHNYLPRTEVNSTDPVRHELNDWVLNNLPGNALYAVDVWGATVDPATGLMDERWRGSPTDVHMNSAGNARVAMATLGGVLPETTHGGYAGAGSPEGKVSAPVGASYSDSAATNGAIRWVKASGTGNTGWQVTSGATGWRNMTAQVPDYVSGSLYVKRSTDLVHLHFDGLVISPEENPFWFVLFTLPEGFRPQRTIHTQMEMGTGSEPGDRYISMNLNGEFRINYPQNRTGAIFGYLTFAPRDRTWPITLPGTPA